ncbi:MAG TPA: TonB-dependent receptor [Vicinamibacterales bacterium]|jgi:hypothetical protein
MRRTVIFALLVALVAFAGAASAQSLTGTLGGKVTDQQGGVLPGVTVTLTGKTGTQTQVTDSKGEYRFIGLTPGSYSVKAELQGFRPKEQQSLDVGVGKTVDVPLQMGVGGLSETVDVVANAVTIDTTSTATDTNMSQDMLFSMPLSHNNPAVSILQYSPGVNDGSAFGGASDGANSLMLDGVDTRDPEGGTAWAFYNYNIIDEVQVGGLGQPAEYGGFTGTVVNTITKSGGNRFSSLSEYRYTSDSLAGNNTDPAITKLNKNLGTPPVIFSMKDYTVQLGGPLKKDKIFFFTSIQRYFISQKVTGPIRQEVSPRFNFKFTFQPTPNDNIVGSLQYDSYNQKGRTGYIPGYAVTSNNQTIDQDSPEVIYNAQYRKVFNASTFLEAKFTGWWGYYDLNPVIQAPAHLDGETGAYSGGAGTYSQYDRTRNQLNAAVSKYAQLAGSHNFKFGAEIERSSIRDRYHYVSPGVYYYDYGGQPYLAYTYGYDLQGKNKRESFYAQDQWKLGRVTANLGVRVDHITGEDSITGKQLYSTLSVGPRVGFAWDVTGKGMSVLKGYYGQLYDSAVFSSWSRAASGMDDQLTYEVGGTVANPVLRKPPINVVPGASKYSVADNIKHPRVDEINFSWEQQIGRDFKFTATGIMRDWKNFVNSTLVNGSWTPFTFANPMPGGPALTLYKWANPGTQQFLIHNTDSVTYNLSNGQTVSVDSNRKYRGMMLVLQRAMRNRWQAQISYVLSKTTGRVGNGTYAGISSGQFETPNTILGYYDGPTSYERRHEVKIFGGYQIPKVEVSLNGYWRYLSGYPYAAFSRMPGSRFAWSGSLDVNLQPRDSNLNDSTTNLDLRAEKVFAFGVHRFGVYVDIANVFNQGAVLSRNTRYPTRSLTDATGQSYKVAFGDPLTLQSGRQATLGFRWSF